MILDGEQTDRLTPDRTLLDATSGNTGIAYAMIGALKGYKVKLCLPGNASHERKQILKSFTDAELVWNLRRAGLSLLTGRPGDAKPVTGIEDTAVRPEQLPEYVGALVNFVAEHPRLG